MRFTSAGQFVVISTKKTHEKSSGRAKVFAPHVSSTWPKAAKADKKNVNLNIFNNNQSRAATKPGDSKIYFYFYIANQPIVGTEPKPAQQQYRTDGHKRRTPLHFGLFSALNQMNMVDCVCIFKWIMSTTTHCHGHVVLRNSYDESSSSTFRILDNVTNDWHMISGSKQTIFTHLLIRPFFHFQFLFS